MAASLGFEPNFLVPETSVLPVRRQGIKKHRHAVLYESFSW